MRSVIGKLWAEGGVSRFYQGWHVAAAQVPITRFVDAGANGGVLELLKGATWIPTVLQTAVASAAAGAFRATLMPLDAVKTELQVRGPAAVPLIRQRVLTQGISTLWRGTWANVVATAVGHYPWFAVSNFLGALAATHVIPLLVVPGQKTPLLIKLAVNAVVGFCASMASDTVTNSIRVVKTRVQTSDEGAGYMDTVSRIVQQDGWYGLFFNGLDTKIFANALNGIIFQVIIKGFK